MKTEFERYRTGKLSEKRTDELIGLCEGIIADNVVNQQEAEFLLKFIKNSRAKKSEWPYNIIYNRVSEMLRDGFLDDEESKQLFEILTQLTGGKEYQEKRHYNTTTLPLDDPQPLKIPFEEKVFCCTGKFMIGSREKVEQLIIDQGGETKKDVSHQIDYLVIGEVGTPSWIHSTYGRKIEKAVKLREKYLKAGNEVNRIKIISEKVFVESLN